VLAVPLCALLLAPPPVHGVALGLYSEDAGFSYAPLLREIAQVGANHVELVINLYQTDGAASALYEHTRFTAPEPAITRAMADARALGLRTVLLPIVRLSAPRPGEWRGNLAPKDLRAWWKSYASHIVRYARLAQRGGAAALVIGSELGTLDGELGPWRLLARTVRRQFGGELLYSANWDHFRDARVWDAVDGIGMSFYFPVDANFATLPGQLEAFARAHGKKPIWLTEVGYLSQRGAGAWPWKEQAQEPVDLEEQRRCYQAFIRAWDGSPALGGLFFWNWYGWGGAGSPGYTPRGKPAAHEIARWFGAHP